MNYEMIAEIALIAGTGFTFLAAVLFFALEIPRTLREFRERREEIEVEKPVLYRAEPDGGCAEMAETVLLGDEDSLRALKEADGAPEPADSRNETADRRDER